MIQCWATTSGNESARTGIGMASATMRRPSTQRTIRPDTVFPFPSVSGSHPLQFPGKRLVGTSGDGHSEERGHALHCSPPSPRCSTALRDPRRAGTPFAVLTGTTSGVRARSRVLGTLRCRGVHEHCGVAQCRATHPRRSVFARKRTAARVTVQDAMRTSSGSMRKRYRISPQQDRSWPHRSRVLEPLADPAAAQLAD